MMLAWENLVCGYADRDALNIPFTGALDGAGIYAVTGPNGCGKSTLLRTWLGLMSPQKGTVAIDGVPATARHDISLGVGYVPQAHKVNRYFQISVEDFIRQGFGPRHRPTRTSEDRVLELLDQWQLAADARRSFHELSGGQKTRAMVARAIASFPKMLFLDEPLASLDVCCQKLLMDTLHELAHQKNVLVVMVDHHFGPFERYLSARIQFNRGHDREICAIDVEEKDDTCCLH